MRRDMEQKREKIQFGLVIFNLQPELFMSFKAVNFQYILRIVSATV